DALRRDCYALIGSAVTTHGGRVLRWTGDGVKADFPTASAAVGAAVDMQRSAGAYGSSAEAVCPFELRIGLSVGEVVVEGNEAHGLAVVEAARLEPLAAPGEVLATDLVRRLGGRRVQARFEDVGTRELKGLDEPVAVVRVVDSAADASTRPFARALSLDRRFPLVGRAAELGAATQAWQAARAGTASTVLVSGAAGMGKSRLLAQVANVAHADGAIVLAGSCDPDLALPYQPFVTAFAAPDLDDDLSRAVTDGEGALGPLFPARRSSPLDDPGPASRFELFQAVVSLVERLARPDPVVLVLDDLQWATTPTIQLLRHLLTHTTTTRLLVLAGYRAEEVGAGHPLRDLLAEHRTSPTTTLLALEPLTPADLAELVTAQVPCAPDDRVQAFTRRLYDEGAGSPFFTCELLHHLAGTTGLDHLLDQEDVDELPIPDSVRDVVDHRLARLPAGDSELLTTAAVVGGSFDLELLAVLSDRRPDEVLATCEDLERMALVQEVDAGRFAFAHAIVRSTVLDRISASRRALAHRRVAEVIRDLGRGDHDELAHHWLQAGDEERANASLERAAQRDLDALAFESAAERYQALLDFQDRQARPDQAAVARALLGRGLAKRALGQPEYFADVEQAGKLGRRLSDVDIVVEAALASLWPGNFFATAGTVNTPLVELTEDALALIGDDDPRRVRLLSTLAAHLSFDPDRSRREAILAAAVTEARRTGDPELVGTALAASYLALWDASTTTRRSEIADELRRLARASGNVDHEFLGGFFTAIGQAEQGRVADARAQLDGLGDAVTASQNFYFRFLTERLLVSIDLLRCEPGTASRVDELARQY
ncbi:MAG TPA: AAA family ATPase, partial [Acidimicrobiales bacterium]|nr:AAA family ATPase [Acidimicrobiales bacterium]